MKNLVYVLSKQYEGVRKEGCSLFVLGKESARKYIVRDEYTGLKRTLNSTELRKEIFEHNVLNATIQQNKIVEKQEDSLLYFLEELKDVFTIMVGVRPYEGATNRSAVYIRICSGDIPNTSKVHELDSTPETRLFTSEFCNTKDCGSYFAYYIEPRDSSLDIIMKEILNKVANRGYSFNILDRYSINGSPMFGYTPLKESES